MNTVPDFSFLSQNGLNLQAVFTLAELPESMRESIKAGVGDCSAYSQLILIGHGGPQMWRSLKASPLKVSDHPIDCFSVDAVKQWFSKHYPDTRYEIIYPAANCIVPLQSLGALAGWHHASPFRIGINQAWGSWFAYRVLILADSDFVPTEPMSKPSPCDSCEQKPCLSVCPAVEVDDTIPLDRCIDYRLVDASRCSNRCLARCVCPIRSEQRYGEEQINYHYGRSLQTIAAYRKGR